MDEARILQECSALAAPGGEKMGQQLDQHDALYRKLDHTLGIEPLYMCPKIWVPRITTKKHPPRFLRNHYMRMPQPQVSGSLFGGPPDRGFNGCTYR